MATEVTMAELKDYEGKTLPPSEWLAISQDRIDQFAECTEDRQFIHVDPEAAKKTPFGTTIAHGFLSLSLLSSLHSPEVPRLRGTVLELNYGLDRVRFVHPVAVGSRVRAHTTVLSVQEKKPGRTLVKCEKTVEIEGEEKPALIAETLAMYVTG
jgi:acyl dehydratase